MYPYLHAMIHLVNTHIPLLELRGMRGICRVNYHAPVGVPCAPSTLLTEIKQATFELGGMDALISCLRRLDRR